MTQQTNITGTLQDTLKKVAELERIINHSPALTCIWRYEKGWLPLYISANVSQYGYLQEDLLSAEVKWPDLIHPDDYARMEEKAIACLRKKITEYIGEYRIFTKNGEIRWVEDRTTAVYNKAGRVDYFHATILDITNRINTQNELRKTEERLHELLHNSLDAIALLDKDGVFIYLSPATKTITGYDERELIGKPCFDFIHPEDMENSIGNFQEVLANQNKFVSAQLRFRHKNGSWVYLEGLGNNCLDNAAIQGIIINARDITERKMLEAQLLHKKKMEAIGTLAAGIAHDFNNILMVIQGYISLMLINMNELDATFEKLISIQSMVESGADLTGKLLGFARDGQYEVKPTDLNDLISKTVNLFGRTKKEIHIHQKYESKLWPAEVDRAQMEQVLLNLYVNSWQAMPQGGEIYVQSENFPLAFAAENTCLPAGDYVKITIADNGTGMDEETRQRIFEPFFSTKDRGRGIGLGLASAYGIIRQHKGIIEVSSKKGQGTTFTIYLPASKKEIPRETYAAKTILKGTETILLVDDEETIIKVCRDILLTLGYKVFTASSGAEALNIYKANINKIDLVLLDMIMPQMSGAETFASLKMIDPDVRVILATGYSLGSQAKELLAKGCRFFIQKPFRIEDLSQKLREILDAAAVS